MSRRSEVGDYVNSRIEKYSENAFLARSQLAALQRGAGKAPGEIPELMGTVLRGMPDGFIGEGGSASKEEWACYTALTLFAMHQQGSDVSKSCVNTTDYVSVGVAANRLKSAMGDAGADDRVFGMLSRVLSADEISGAAWYLKSMVQLFKKHGIKVNYGLLAEDLYAWQFPTSKNRVSLRWGQDYVKTYVKKEEN